MAKFSQSVLDFVGGVGGNVLAQELVFNQRDFWNFRWTRPVPPGQPTESVDLTGVTIDAQIVRRSITNFSDSRQGLVFDIGNYPSTPTAAIATQILANRIIVDTTNELFEGKPIRFAGNLFGGVQPDTTYYVFQIFSSTEFSITASVGGPVFVLSDGTGFMNVNYIKPTPINLPIINREDTLGKFTLTVDSNTWSILQGDKDLNIDGTPACFTGRIKLSFPQNGPIPAFDESIFLLFLIYSDGVVNYE